MVHNPSPVQNRFFPVSNFNTVVPAQWVKIGVVLSAIVAVGLIYRNWESICSTFYGSRPKGGAGDGQGVPCKTSPLTQEQQRNVRSAPGDGENSDTDSASLSQEEPALFRTPEALEREFQQLKQNYDNRCVVNEKGGYAGQANVDNTYAKLTEFACKHPEFNRRLPDSIVRTRIVKWL